MREENRANSTNGKIVENKHGLIGINDNGSCAIIEIVKSSLGDSFGIILQDKNDSRFDLKGNRTNRLSPYWVETRKEALDIAEKWLSDNK